MWAVEEIEEMGPGGNLLMAPLTLKLMRSDEMLSSPLVNIEEERGASMQDRAHKRVLEILNGRRSSVPENVQEDLCSYAKQHASEM